MVKNIVIISFVGIILLCSMVGGAVADDGAASNGVTFTKVRSIDSTTQDPVLKTQDAGSAQVNAVSSTKTPVRKRPVVKPTTVPKTTIPTLAPKTVITPALTTIPTTMVTTIPTTVPTTIVTTMPPATPTQAAYNGPHTVPVRIEVEDYDIGGPGVAYSDADAENFGGAGRLAEGVDVSAADGITAVSWIYDGEWTEYTVEVGSSGTYTATFRVGSPSSGQQIAVSVDGAAGCVVDVPNTGSYSAYTTVSAPLVLTAGTHVLRLTYRAGEYGQVVDWFELAGGTLTTVPTTVPTTIVTTVPTTIPTTSGSTLDPAMTDAQAASIASSASSSGYARLNAMQAAWHAWSVPSNPSQAATATNVLSSGLKNDGATDNTGSLQSLLNSLPSGSTLYFPSGTYRLDGPITISRAVTLLGDSGTVLDCRKATRYVITINKGGSATSKLGGVSITGFVIEGPGIETDPAMIDGYYLQNLRISYVKFHNVGYAAVRINTCTDATVEHCIFDNVFQTGLGYGVVVTDHSDRILIRNNFFVTKGRHSFTTGTDNPSLPVEDYVRQVTFENNYCENTQGWGSAADTHEQTVGPIIVRNNVFNNCQHGVRLRGGYGEIYDNVVVGTATDQVGVYVYDQAIQPNAFDTKPNKIERNTVLGTIGVGILCGNSNDLVRDNILSCSGSRYGLYVDGRYYTPEQVLFERNIVRGFSKYIDFYLAGTNVDQVSNWYI